MCIGVALVLNHHPAHPGTNYRSPEACDFWFRGCGIRPSPGPKDGWHPLGVGRQDSFGQVGVTGATYFWSPVSVGLSDVVAIATGQSFSMALRSDLPSGFGVGTRPASSATARPYKSGRTAARATGRDDRGPAIERADDAGTTRT